MSDQLPHFTPIRHIKALRVISKLLPLKHRLSPLVNKYTHVDGLLSVAWGNYQLLFPSQWHQSFTMASFIFEGRNIIPEAILLKTIFSNLKEGILVDVGAHIGCYVLEFRSLSSQPIVAFEPSPAVFDILKTNVLLNELQDVKLKNIACGSTTGSISMDVGINSSITPTDIELSPDIHSTVTGQVSANSTSPTQAEVELTTLDNELSGSNEISLIKIDCEGFEYHVLSGAINIIRKHRPILFIELHPQLIGQYGFQPKDVCDLLRPYYDLHFYNFDSTLVRDPYIRFLKRYLPNRGYKIPTEEEMLKVASSGSAPAQLYILGLPKI